MAILKGNKLVLGIVVAVIVLGLVLGGITLTRPPAEPEDIAAKPVAEDPAEEPAEEEEAAAAAVTLHFVGWEASPLETESVRKGLDAFMTQNPNITVEYTPVPHAEYETKLITSMAGGAGADVFFVGAELYRSLQLKGQLLDITEYFEAEFELDYFIPSAVSIMLINDRIYGVSSSTVSPILFYNRDIFDKAGLPYPPKNPDEAWTWDEFVEIAKQLTIVEAGETTQFGVFGLENPAWPYMKIAMFLSNEGNVFNEDFTRTTLNTPEVKEVLQSVFDLREKYGVSPEALLLEQLGMSPSHMLQTGRVAMLIDGSWALQQLAQMDFPVGIGVLPKFDSAVTHGQAHLHSAWIDTPNPYEAWKLISFLSSEEYQLDLIHSGLWMPNRTALYTEEGIARWFNPDVHPEGFMDVVPFIRDAIAYPPAFNVRPAAMDIIAEELGAFFDGGKPLNETLADIEIRVNEELAREQ